MYSYYCFIDRFHIEPKSWQELIEYSDYIGTEALVNKFVADSAKQEK